MSPINSHLYKNNKRKLDGPTDLLLKAQIYQNDPDDDVDNRLGQGQQQQYSTLDTIQIDTIDTNRVEAWTPDTQHNLHLLLHKRQDIPPSITSSPLGVTPTPTQQPPPQEKLKGEDPLSNLAIQLILGGLAAIVLLAVLLRCIHVNRQQRSLLDTRRRHNLTAAQAQLSILDSAHHRFTGARTIHVTNTPGTTGTTGTTMVTPLGTHLVPTNNTTLAARLRMYQSQAQSWRDPYPYGQQPAIGMTGVEVTDSVSSFVAPSYEQDVSPPPFMNSVGKPPAYAEAVSETVLGAGGVPPSPPPPAQQQQQHQQGRQESRRSSMSPDSMQERPAAEP
ncbi:MAG: hypothetical protein JOS17DRAFT_803592 [Linnemannia elongata]|nr:MAG: hypothetical protein JOS17DRAFT_803592 [Linnemannia elongata]